MTLLVATAARTVLVALVVICSVVSAKTLTFAESTATVAVNAYKEAEGVFAYTG